MTTNIVADRRGMAPPQVQCRLALCRKLTGGNANAAELLHLIAALRPSKTAQKDGAWIARKRSWWASEARMSLDQIRRALTVMRRQSLIETRQGLVACADGVPRNILHLRLTESCRRTLLEVRE